MADDLARAIEAFVHGFCFTRSFTHPYVPQRVGPLWVVRDAPRTRASDHYRNEEWIACGVPPEKAHELAHAQARGRYRMCAIRHSEENDQPLRSAYKALGYRLAGTEAIMLHRLKRVPRVDAPAEIQQIKTLELANRLNKSAKSRQILPEHLSPDSPLRQYVALDGDQPVGWVRCVRVGDASWVSNMFVKPTYRRRGIGGAMLSRLLRDDKASSLSRSFLTASHAGAMLYSAIGYEQIGLLLSFCPCRRRIRNA
jgi:ribosomal protein S18 acetylase RimI-like enzyme